MSGARRRGPLDACPSGVLGTSTLTQERQIQSHTGVSATKPRPCTGASYLEQRSLREASESHGTLVSWSFMITPSGLYATSRFGPPQKRISGANRSSPITTTTLPIADPSSRYLST